MANPLAILARRIGPFPLGGWIGVSAAGIGTAVVVRRRTSGLTEPEGSQIETPQPFGDSTLGPPFGTEGALEAPFEPAIPATPPPQIITAPPITFAASTCRAQAQKLVADIRSRQAKIKANRNEYDRLKAQRRRTRRDSTAHKRLTKRMVALRQANAKLRAQIGALQTRLTVVRIQCAAVGVKV